MNAPFWALAIAAPLAIAGAAANNRRFARLSRSRSLGAPPAARKPFKGSMEAHHLCDELPSATAAVHLLVGVLLRWLTRARRPGVEYDRTRQRTLGTLSFFPSGRPISSSPWRSSSLWPSSRPFPPATSRGRAGGDRDRRARRRWMMNWRPNSAQLLASDQLGA